MKKTRITTRVCGEQRHLETYECVPLVPRMIWMLCPAVILAWTSVVLLVPGISRSERSKKMQINQQFIVISIIREEKRTGRNGRAV